MTTTASSPRLLLEQIAFLDGKITQITTRIDASVAAIPAAWGPPPTGPPAHRGTGPDAAALPAADRLAEIPGISPLLARTIIAESGLDMTRSPLPHT